MEVVSNEFIAEPNRIVAQFGTVPEPLPNWGLPFCMELRFVFETQQKRYYVLDAAGVVNLAEIMNDGLPEPTVLFIAAELGLALEGLHELGVSYNELDLGNVTVDNWGHVVLWREFEGKEYWHISECICGLHGVDCAKTAHEVKRRGINVPPGQRHWKEIAQGIQDDWRSLGVLLCQMLTGQLDFPNKSLEEVIISLFITPNTKDFLYGLVTGAVQSFEDLKCHPCFDGLDWEEVKSKSHSSPLMANIRSRMSNSTPSSRFSKSPSLQNVYTAGMSAQHERGVLMKSALSRTHSTSELHSWGNTPPNLSAFDRQRSGRRSTLSVFYSGSGRNGRVGVRNDTLSDQGDTKFRGHSKSVGAKSSLSLKRQVLKQNSRGLDRPPCMSAPCSPRHSLDTAPSYVYPSPISAPSSLPSSVTAIHSVNSSNSPPTTTIPIFNEPETNPFHEGYKKRWGSATLDTAFELYSSNMKLTENSTIPSVVPQLVETVNTNNPPYGIYTGDLNDKGSGSIPYSNTEAADECQLNTYAFANGVYSPVLIQNGNSTILDTSGMSMNSGQASSHPVKVCNGYQTRHSIDVSSGSRGVCCNSRNSINTGTNPTYFHPNDVPNYAVQELPQERFSVETDNGIYFSNMQLSPGNVSNMNYLAVVDRTNAYRLQEPVPQRRRSSKNLDTTDGTQSLRIQTSTNNTPWSMSSCLNQTKDNISCPNNELFQKRRGSINRDTSDGVYSSFFQTSPNNENESACIERSNPKEIANVLFQQHFRSKRGSVDSQNSGRVSPNSRTSRNYETKTCIDGSGQVSYKEGSDILREQTHVRQSDHRTRVVQLFPSNTSNQNEYTEAKLQQGLSYVRRGSVGEYPDLRTFPKEELRNEYEQSIQLRDPADNVTQELVRERSIALNTSSNNLTSPRDNTPSHRRNSRSPEPVVAIHMSTLQVPPSPVPNSQDVSVILCHNDAEDFKRFQEQSQRRRSSTDVASLSFQGVSARKSETPSRKTALSRSVSYSNMSEGYGNAENGLAKSGSIGRINCKRSMALRPIPSFEEFRTMRALNKMAYGAECGKDGNQRDENNNGVESNKDNVNNTCGSRNNSGNNNDDDNKNSSRNSNSNSNNNSRNIVETTTTSPTSNPVIQDLLVKYGLDKSYRSSTVKAYQNSNKRTDARNSNSPTPPAQSHNQESTSSDTPDTKQRLLNILDDFLAVRNKHRKLTTSSSMINVKAVDSYRDQRRPSLPNTLIEENLSNNARDCYDVNSKSLDVKVARGLPVKVDHPVDCESVGDGELCSPKSEAKRSTNPSLVISSPNSECIIRRKKNSDTNTASQSKVEHSLQKTDKKNYNENPRRKSKKTNTTKKRSLEVQQSENKLTSPCEQSAKITLEDCKSNNDTNECTVSSSSELKQKEPEVGRRVSEKARKHRESLELAKKTGKKAKKERRKSFTHEVLQNKNKESNSGQDECNSQKNGTDDKQPVVILSGPVKGDHSFEIESPSVEERDMKYLRLMNRRTSSLLSLTDDLSENIDEFEPEDLFTNRSESLSEVNEECEYNCSRNSTVGRGDSFLCVKSDTDLPRGQHVSRTESSSSLLSRCSSFHSNYSGDSGSVHLDFEDSDDDLFYLAEPRETHEKSESEIQRNDSGLGDEIGVGTRVKKRWEEFGRISSRQSMIVASWRELATKKEGIFEERQEQEKEMREIQHEHGQRQRKISRERRISRERQPNAIDCPDCGRAFLAEKDKPSVKSQGPNKALICYKCQSHRVERKEAIIELVQTEINYGNDFQIIKEEFLSPMQMGGIVSPDNLAKIFLNIQELLDVSTKFCKKIQTSMEERINQNDEELCHMEVGKIFVENVELLQAYELYCSKQPEAISLLESLQKKNDVLRVFLTITCRENPKCRKMDINSFLLAPVQRVTKYPLLLSRIRRATPRWHGDREDLKLAQRKVEEQIAKINSLTKSSEMKAKKFQGNLGTSDSVDSSRLKKLASDVLAWTLDEMQLLMHGQFKVLCSEFGGGQSWTKRAIKRSVETHLLFCIRGQNEPINVDSEEDDCLQFPNASEISDASLLLLKRKSNGKYTLFRDEIKLRDCVVYEETESDSFGMIHMGKESFVFTARTSKDARKWIKYLKLQMIKQGKWRRRRNASANIMLKRS